MKNQPVYVGATTGVCRATPRGKCGSTIWNKTYAKESSLFLQEAMFFCLRYAIIEKTAKYRFLVGDD